MSFILVTGTSDDNRVTSKRAGALNAGLFGAGVLAVKDSFAAELRGTNLVIGPGDGLVDGRHFAIEGSVTVDLSAISSHADRTGYVYIEYSRDASGSENANLVARQGSLNEPGSILSGDTSARRALMYVDMDAESVEPMYTEVKPATEKDKEEHGALEVIVHSADLSGGVTLEANKSTCLITAEIKKGMYAIRGKTVFAGSNQYGKDTSSITLYESDSSYGYGDAIHCMNTDVQVLQFNFVYVNRDTVIKLWAKSTVARTVKVAEIRLMKLT